MIAIAGKPIPVEVTLDPGLLFVAMKIFDVTSGFPGTLVGSAIAMTEFDTGNYGANFVGTANKSYVVSKAVYTDGTYATRDSNYSIGSEAFQVESSSGTPPTAAAIADAVWDETLASHLTLGSTGAKLNTSGTGGGFPAELEIQAIETSMSVAAIDFEMVIESSEEEI